MIGRIKKPCKPFSGIFSKGLFGVLCLAMFLPDPAWAQEEVTSEMSRFRSDEMITKSYERYEFKPRAHLPFIRGEVPRKALVTLSTTAEKVRIRRYLADAHRGLKFYERRTCVDCHPRQARDLHTIRERITCRQCHGPEPIAGIQHYYSPMNPRRRYAFVCARCHEGVGASFGTYLIHPPNPAHWETLKTFPVLFMVFWAMIALAVGTFLVFLPHTLLWGLRELFVRKEKHPVAHE